MSPATSAALAKDLRALTQPQFLVLSKSMFAGLLRCLEGIAEHAKLFDSFDPPYVSSFFHAICLRFIVE